MILQKSRRYWYILWTGRLDFCIAIRSNTFVGAPMLPLNAVLSPCECQKWQTISWSSQHCCCQPSLSRLPLCHGKSKPLEHIGNKYCTVTLFNSPANSSSNQFYTQYFTLSSSRSSAAQNMIMPRQYSSMCISSTKWTTHLQLQQSHPWCWHGLLTAHSYWSWLCSKIMRTLTFRSTRRASTRDMQ
jgi:hypothetical protein